jgi:hypothetical protein
MCVYECARVGDKGTAVLNDAVGMLWDWRCAAMASTTRQTINPNCGSLEPGAWSLEPHSITALEAAMFLVSIPRVPDCSAAGSWFRDLSCIPCQACQYARLPRRYNTVQGYYNTRYIGRYLILYLVWGNASSMMHNAQELLRFVDIPSRITCMIKRVRVISAVVDNSP